MTNYLRLYKRITVSSYTQVYQELEDIRAWAALNQFECHMGINWNSGQTNVRLETNEAVTAFFLRFDDWGCYYPTWEDDEDLNRYPWNNLETMLRPV